MLFHIGYQHHRRGKTQWYPHFTKADKTADNSVYIAEFCYATDKNRSQIKMKVKKQIHTTLWKPVSDTSNILPNTKIYTFLWKKYDSRTPTCNWHIKARGQQWHNPPNTSAKQTTSFIGLSSLNLDSVPNTPAQSFEGSPPKKITLKSIFFAMTKTFAFQSWSNFCS